MFCGMGERTPRTHDTNMERKERKEHGGKEGKERTRERKGKEICQDFLVFSQGWRTSGTCMCMCISRVEITILLKELKELDSHHSIIEGASLMSTGR